MVHLSIGNKDECRRWLRQAKTLANDRYKQWHEFSCWSYLNETMPVFIEHLDHPGLRCRGNIGCPTLEAAWEKCGADWLRNVSTQTVVVVHGGWSQELVSQTYNEAGLPPWSALGLRKAAARRLAGLAARSRHCCDHRPPHYRDFFDKE